MCHLVCADTTWGHTAALTNHHVQHRGKGYDKNDPSSGYGRDVEYVMHSLNYEVSACVRCHRSSVQPAPACWAGSGAVIRASNHLPRASPHPQMVPSPLGFHIPCHSLVPCPARVGDTTAFK